MNNLNLNLNLIDDLAFELKDIIFSYLPLYRSVFLNKIFYFKNHKYLKVNSFNKENYYRDIIRNDNIFVFAIILKENYEKWKKIPRYVYKNMSFHNYLAFVNYWIIHNNSSNCKNEIDKLLIKDYGKLSKNEFKKKSTIINKRWKH
jgi:hypothetical protein